MRDIRTSNNRIIRVGAMIISFIMIIALCVPYAEAAGLTGYSKEGSSAGGNVLTVKYPEILSDVYWHADKKADFKLNGESRFYIVIEDEESEEASSEESAADLHIGRVSARLLETVELMSAVYAEHGIPGGKPLLVFFGDEKYALPGDILVKLVPKEEQPDIERQSYRLDITDKAMVTSKSEDGIYYGLITLMELLVRSANYENNQGYADPYSQGYSSGYSQNSYGQSGYDQSAYGTSDGSQEGKSAGEGSEQPARTIKLKSFSAVDGPDLEERAIFLDCGRKYFSPEWIKRLIRRSSMQRYNTLILHFSEASALRLESRVFPWLTEDVDYLTMDEMADIVRFAQRYHMKVVPSFDVPGHNKYIVEKYSTYVSEHPEFTFEYKGRTYGPVGGAPQDAEEVEGQTAEAGSDTQTQIADDFASIANHYTHNGYTQESNWIGIDLTKEHAVAFLDAMIDDYAEFFRELGCTDFDLGGDEVLGYSSMYIGGDLLKHENRWDFVEHWADYAQGVMKIPGGSASDTYIHYLNRTASRLMNMGYTCRVFNDEIDINHDQHFRLLTSIELSYWNAGRRSAKHFAGDGYKLYNCISRWCYFASGRADGVDIMNGKYYTVNGQNIFENWDPFSYSSNSYNPKPIKAESCGGGYFCIWCDEPDYKSDETIFWETEMRTWANSARLWDSRHRESEEGESATSDGAGESAYESAGAGESFAGKTFGYYDLESFAGLIRGARNYGSFANEDQQINGSGKPLNGETWYKLTRGLLDWHEKTDS